jgi:hypothetical protein
MEITLNTMVQAVVYLRWGTAVLLYATGRAKTVQDAYDVANQFTDALMRDLRREMGK